MLGFYLAVVLGELAFLGLAWLLARTVLAVVQGDLTSPIAVRAAVLTAAGLCLVAWRGSRALPAVQRAIATFHDHSCASTPSSTPSRPSPA